MASNGDHHAGLDGFLGELAVAPMRTYRSPTRMLGSDREELSSRLVKSSTAKSPKRGLSTFRRKAEPSVVFDEPTDDDWIGKLRSAVAGYERVGADMVRMLAARSAVHRHLGDVLDLWSKTLERAPQVAIAIGQALPHLFDAVTKNEAERPRVVKLFGQSLVRAHSIDRHRVAVKRGGAATELGALAQALLAADMSVPSAHPSVIEIVRTHRSILSSDVVTWPYFAPYA